ncbi:MAG TPA: hypothetical protein VJN70_14390 [Gemmatimonadaceae bacterium]|nr:hypothetical protein [Gemmatimonadaceae bacterium]
MTKRNSIRIELTPEQQQQFKEFSGRDISALEVEAQELEPRIAPLTYQLKSIEVSSWSWGS